MGRHADRLLSPSIVVRGCFTIALAVSAGAALWAIVTDYSLVEALHPAKAEHLDQKTLYDLVRANKAADAFTEAFEHGDELFETEFTSVDGVGANVGDGTRFTRVPRADLAGPGQWASHTPKRATGPNAISCNACHVQLFDDGSGSAVGNVHRDPLHSGNLKQFIQRNTPHVFALGASQRLAEEMTEALQQTRTLASDQACSAGSVTLPLMRERHQLRVDPRDPPIRVPLRLHLRHVPSCRGVERSRRPTVSVEGHSCDHPRVQSQRGPRRNRDAGGGDRG